MQAYDLPKYHMALKSNWILLSQNKPEYHWNITFTTVSLFFPISFPLSLCLTHTHTHTHTHIKVYMPSYIYIYMQLSVYAREYHMKINTQELKHLNWMVAS